MNERMAWHVKKTFKNESDTLLNHFSAKCVSANTSANQIDLCAPTLCSREKLENTIAKPIHLALKLVPEEVNRTSSRHDRIRPLVYLLDVSTRRLV